MKIGSLEISNLQRLLRGGCSCRCLRDHAIPKDNSDTSVIDSLRPLKGAEFDKAYAQKVGVQWHKDAIHAFGRKSPTVRMPTSRRRPKKALPTVEDHYRMSQTLAQKVGD
ncbi:DUF4142 domain-containing protein [Paraburkholderia bannensis]|uniref:DUF4142 domain-containing protein n=1 Tax=Paraburkholderia bannensis TaxID=765414 RepID=UPI000A01B7EB|nr:DUF4142 domain-containing protein [Paraburkholderia bannensis]